MSRQREITSFLNLQWQVGGQGEFCFLDVFLKWSLAISRILSYSYKEIVKNLGVEPKTYS